MRKRIGLTMRVMSGEGSGEPRDAIARDWMSFLLEEVDVLPVCLPNVGAPAAQAVQELGLEGVILTGGEDPGTQPARDRTEWALLDYCRSSGLPVVGVCRGMQVIQRYFGGDLVPCPRTVHVGTSHEVEMVDDRFGTVCSRRIVNSFHALGLTASMLAAPLRAFAVSPDGMVEGLFHPQERLMGMLWHPERAGSDRQADAALLRQGLDVVASVGRR